MLFQNIVTQGATDWEYFTIAGQNYLAVANGCSDTSWTISSQVFRFDGFTFIPFQSIQTQGANDWEYFTIANQSYLAVANWYNGNSHLINSQILRFDGTRFVPFQSILTAGAFGFEFFNIAGQSYLAVANNFANSQVYRFNGTSFAPFQPIATTGASDCEFFSIGSQSYLAISNEQDMQSSSSSYSTNSLILRWNGGVFVPFTSIPTTGAMDVAYFTIGSQSYLAVANWYNGTAYSINSQVLRLARVCF
jgi:hypothetical protein